MCAATPLVTDVLLYALQMLCTRSLLSCSHVVDGYIEQGMSLVVDMASESEHHGTGRSLWGMQGSTCPVFLSSEDCFDFEICIGIV